MNARPVLGRGGRKVVKTALRLDRDHALQMHGIEWIAGFLIEHADAQPDVVSNKCDRGHRDQEKKQASNSSRQLSRGKQGRGFSQEKLGWAMGFEPTTLGATVRCSTAELRPPQSKILTRRVGIHHKGGQYTSRVSNWITRAFGRA